MILIIGIIYLSYNMDSLMEYIINHATSINDLIIKIYYPAGIYAKLISDFKIWDLIIFILVNVIIFGIAILILSKFYFKINSRMKKVTTSKNISVNKLSIKAGSKVGSLIKKELNTFFKIPVFIINAGFALILFLIAVVVVVIKFDMILTFLVSEEGGLGLSTEVINNSISILIFGLISAVSYLTSITNSVISLEGRNISILKSLPIDTKTILLSKVFTGLVITTPVMLLGDIILFIKFKVSIIEMILLIILSVLIPLVSHFIGILVNLKYPKLDYENSAEVVKQSASSFIAVMIGMILLMITVIVITNIIDKYKASLILGVAVLGYILINIILYLRLSKKGVREFNSLSV